MSFSFDADQPIPSSQPYKIIDDISPKSAVGKNFKFPQLKVDTAATTTASEKKNQLDYSADNSFTAMGSEDDTPIRSRGELSSPLISVPQYVRTSVTRDINNKKILVVDKNWASDLISGDEIIDEEAGIKGSTIQNSTKFVRGLPTVVTKDKSCKFHCILCQYEGLTEIDYKYNKALIGLIIVFFITLFWPCMVYAIWSPRWKNIVHKCPECKTVVGKRKPSI